MSATKTRMTSDPIDHLHDTDEALDVAHEAASRYIASLPERLVRPPAAESIAPSLGGPLPEAGDGTLAAVWALIAAGEGAAIGSAGGRFFHFVVGGVTPAAPSTGTRARPHWSSARTTRPGGSPPARTRGSRGG